MSFFTVLYTLYTYRTLRVYTTTSTHCSQQRSPTLYRKCGYVGVSTYKVTFTLGTDEWVYILHFSLCAYSTCILYTGETYALVDWVGEESSSVVQSTKIGCMGVFAVGEVAKVRTSTGTFKAVIVASGKKLVHLVVVHLYTLNM